MEVEFPPSDDDSIYESDHEVVLERPPLSPVGRPLTGYAAKTLDDALDIIEAEEMSSDEPESSEGSTEALSESLDPISDDDMVDVNGNVKDLRVHESEVEDVAHTPSKAVPNATNVDVRSLTVESPDDTADDDAMDTANEADAEVDTDPNASGMDFMMSDLDPPAAPLDAEEPDDMEVTSPQHLKVADNDDFVQRGPVSGDEEPSVTAQLPEDHPLSASADVAHGHDDDPEVDGSESMSRPTSMGEEVLFEARRSSDERTTSRLDAAAAEQLVIDAEVEAPKLHASDELSNSAVDVVPLVEPQRERELQSLAPEPAVAVDVPEEDDLQPDVEATETAPHIEASRTVIDVEEQLSEPDALVDEVKSTELTVEPESNEDSDTIVSNAAEPQRDVESSALPSAEGKEDERERTESPVKVEETMTKADDSWTKRSVGADDTKPDNSWNKTSVDVEETKPDNGWTKTNVEEETEEEAIGKERSVEVDDTLAKPDNSWTKAVGNDESSEGATEDSAEETKADVEEKVDEEELKKEEEAASAGPFSFRSTLASFGASVFGKFGSTTEDEGAVSKDDAEKSQEDSPLPKGELVSPQTEAFADAETETDISEASRALPEPQVIEQLVEEATAKVDAEELARSAQTADDEDEEAFVDAAESSSVEPEAAPQVEAESEEELVAQPQVVVEAEPEAQLQVEKELEATEADQEVDLGSEQDVSGVERELPEQDQEDVLVTEQRALPDVEAAAESEEVEKPGVVESEEAAVETAREGVPETQTGMEGETGGEVDLEEEELEGQVKMTTRTASLGQTAKVIERTESGQENLVVAPAMVELDMNKETAELLEKGEVKTPELTKEETRQLDLSNTSLDVPDVEDIKDVKHERKIGEVNNTVDDSLRETKLDSGASLDIADATGEMDEIQIDKPMSPMTRMVTAPPIPGGTKSANKMVPPARALSADEFGADQYIVEEAIDGKGTPMPRKFKANTSLKGAMMRTPSQKSFKKSGGGGFLSSMSSFLGNIRKPSKSKDKKKDGEADEENEEKVLPRVSEQSDKKSKSKDKKRRTFIARDSTKSSVVRDKSATDSANGSVRQDSLVGGEVDNLIEMRTPEEKAEEERHLRLEETLKSQIATLRSARSGFVDLALLTPMTEKTLAMVEFEAKRILGELPEVEERKEKLARRVELLEMTTEAELLQKEKTLVAAKIRVAEAKCELDKLRHELFILNRELNEPRKDIAHRRMRIKARKAKAQKELGAATESKETMERNLEQRKAMLSACKAEVSQLEKSVKDIAGEW